MSVRMIDPQHFEVDSDSSDRRYLVTYGLEGPYLHCTCVSYAIKRNRAGGLGHPGRCKHIDQVEAYQPRIAEQEKENLKAAEQRLRDHLKRIESL